MPLSSPLRLPLRLGLTALAARRGGGVGPAPDQLLGVPSGFDWTPPVNVYRTPGGTYYTDYDPTPFLIEGEPGVTTMYVDSATGNNSNPGTAALPKATLLGASNMSRLPALLIKARGEFYIGDTSQMSDRHDNTCLVAWDDAYLGVTTYRNPATPLSWTDEGGGVWSTTPPNASFNGLAVYFGTDPDSLTRYPTLTTLAACQSTPGSAFRQTSPSIKHFVHTLDGSSPATGHTALAANGAAQSIRWNQYAYNQRFAFHGVTFIGGDNAMRCEGASSSSKRADFVGCTFMRSTANAFQSLGGVDDAIIIHYNCVAKYAETDGFSYHTTNATNNGTAVAKAIEINCQGVNNGLLVSGANQGSTTHFGGKVLRVNSTYSNNQHQQVADVGGGSQSWNAGCTFGPRRAGNDISSGVDVGNNADIVNMWIDGCAFSDLPYDVLISAGGTMFYRNMPLPNINPSSSGSFVLY
jgi:hypothetical protein